MANSKYFAHDIDALNDPKMIAMMTFYGVSGYGIFFGIIETMASESNYMLKKDDFLYPVLSHKLKMSISELEQIVNDFINKFKLLSENEEYIFSQSFVRRMLKTDEKIEVLRANGKRGGLAKPNQDKDIKQEPSKTEANAEQMLKQEPSKTEAINKLINKQINKQINKESVNTPPKFSHFYVEANSEEFENEMFSIIESDEKYFMPDNEIQKFIAHWTSETPKGKMKFQEEKSFDMKGRVRTWKNQSYYGGNKANAPNRVQSHAYNENGDYNPTKDICY